ncbi:MAG: hypothetical protein J6S17_00630 [Aeriscardovia sp.]|nr:hypothetical protein [Aeriscardovia sp.]
MICAYTPWRGGRLTGTGTTRIGSWISTTKLRTPSWPTFPLKNGGRVPLARVYECLLSHGVVTSKQAVSRAIEAAGIPGLFIEAKRGRAREVVGIQIK